MSSMQLRTLGAQLSFLPDVFGVAECGVIAAAIEQGSAHNALSGAFDGTYGFQRVFRKDGLPELLAEYPWLAGFITAAVGDARCDAFYLNGLIIAGGREVKRHLDCSLNGWLGYTRTPEEVTVLYVRVPDDLHGGELQLFDDRGRVAEISPRTGAVLRFAGELTHRVAPVRSSTARISVVLEQYAVGEDARARIPRYAGDADGHPTRPPAAPQLATKLARFAQALSAEEREVLEALVRGRSSAS